MPSPRPLSLTLAAILGAAATFCVAPALTGTSVTALFFEVADVAHGRVPLVDTTAGAGWGALDALGAIFAVLGDATEGRVVLAVGIASALCGLLVVVLASGLTRSTGTALFGAGAAVAVLALAAPAPDALSPAAGALTMLPVLAVLAACAHHRTRGAAVVLAGVAVWWSPPAGFLGVVALTIASRSWPRSDRERLRRWSRPTAAAVLAVFVVSALARAGALPGPVTMLNELLPASGPPGIGPGAVAVIAAVGALLAAAVAALPGTHEHGRALFRARSRGDDAAADGAARATVAVAALVTLWGVVDGSAITLAHGTALALLALGAHPGRGRVTVGLTTGLALLAIVGPGHAQDRWKTTALYDAMPHQVLRHLGFGEHVGGSLRHDLDDLLEHPRVAEDGFTANVFRRDRRMLLLGDATGISRVFAATGTVSVLPLGDPTRDELPVFLRGPLDEAIDALPDGARLIARTDWVAAAVANTWPPRPAGPAYDALLRLLQRRKLRTLGSAGGATLVEVGPPPAD